MGRGEEEVNPLAIVIIFEWEGALPSPPPSSCAISDWDTPSPLLPLVLALRTLDGPVLRKNGMAERERHKPPLTNSIKLDI